MVCITTVPFGPAKPPKQTDGGGNTPIQTNSTHPQTHSILLHKPIGRQVKSTAPVHKIPKSQPVLDGDAIWNIFI